ncbi:pre-rRNA-processing protein ESF2-like [Cryptomeria japonica]|uniref:pre-rRNA-processing protein ESF2-like n=1 Tax=Cryptomeria japonica TaxID=3369 RepID=UPI0027DA3912|nr:pre-rRNA-processing protein ESF2-like [Cryptomeria japonica]
MGDVSDEEEEEEEEEEFQEAEGEEQIDPEEQRTIRLLKAMKGDQYKVRVDLPVYGGNLNEEELLDWIAAMDTYFESEDIPDDQKVKVAKNKLKGHAPLWWDYEKAERRKK